MDELPDRCVPCRRGSSPLSPAAADAYHESVPEWTLDFPRLRRRFRLVDFAAALAWVNRVGELAESEGHHPDFHLTDWNRVELVLWTHAIGGLHRNDFIMAAKTDELFEGVPAS